DADTEMIIDFSKSTENDVIEESESDMDESLTNTDIHYRENNFMLVNKIIEQSDKIGTLYEDLLASEREKNSILTEAINSLKNVNETLKSTIIRHERTEDKRY